MQGVCNDTVHRLHDEYRRVWERADREVTAGSQEIETLGRGTADNDTLGIELREIQEKEIDRLREQMEAGRITEADFLLPDQRSQSHPCRRVNKCRNSRRPHEWGRCKHECLRHRVWWLWRELQNYSIPSRRRLRAASVAAPAKSSKAFFGTSMSMERMNGAPSAAPCAASL